VKTEIVNTAGALPSSCADFLVRCPHVATIEVVKQEADLVP